MNAEDYRLAALGDADAQVRVADYYDEYLRGEHDGPIDVSDETAKELILKLSFWITVIFIRCKLV